MTSIQTERHRHYFNEFELKEIDILCLRLGKALDELSRKELTVLLAIYYNHSHEARECPDSCFAGLTLGRHLLSTVRRYEIERHLANPRFVLAAGGELLKLENELKGIRQVLTSNRRCEP